MMLLEEQKFMKLLLRVGDKIESGVPESFNVLIKEIRALSFKY